VITDALEGSGIAQGAKVLDVEFCGYVGTGQAGRVAPSRAHLEYGRSPDRPISLMAKVPCVDPMPRAALFGSDEFVAGDGGSGAASVEVSEFTRLRVEPVAAKNTGEGQ
jgi:hypothetical protein